MKLATFPATPQIAGGGVGAGGGPGGSGPGPGPGSGRGVGGWGSGDGVGGPGVGGPGPGWGGEGPGAGPGGLGAGPGGPGPGTPPTVELCAGTPTPDPPAPLISIGRSAGETLLEHLLAQLGALAALALGAAEEVREL